MRKLLTVSALLAALCGGFVMPAAAQSLESLLDEALKKHDRILKAKADVDAAREEAKAALADWYPELDATANHGFQGVMNPHADNTRLPFSEVDLTLTQRLWDFGASNAAIKKARLEFEEAQLKLAQVRAKFIREGAILYVSVVGSNAFLKYTGLLADAVRKKVQHQRKDNSSLSTEDQVSETLSEVEEPRQFELEKDEFDEDVSDSFSLTDSDNSDSVKIWDELTKAQRTEIKDNLKVRQIYHDFRKHFGFQPNPEKLKPASLLLDYLPTSVEDALEQAFEHNAEIRVAKIKQAQAQQELKATRSEEFFPTIEGIVQRKWKNNVDGTTDLKVDTLAKVEMSMTFNLGMTATNTLRAAVSDVSSSAHDLADTRLEIENDVRDAWDKMKASQQLQKVTEEQIAIREFLLTEAKRNEESALKILGIEKTIYKARRDYVQERDKVSFEIYKLLELTGRFNSNIFHPEQASYSAPDVPPRETARTPKNSASEPTASQPARGQSPSLPTGPATKPASQSSLPAETVAPASSARQGGVSGAPHLSGPTSVDEHIADAAKQSDQKFFATVRDVFDKQFQAQDLQNRPDKPITTIKDAESLLPSDLP